MWNEVTREEQETIIHIDYYERTIMFYTTRKSVATKMEKKIGKADRIYKMQDKKCAVEYKRKLSDKNIKQFLSVANVVGGFRKEIESEELRK